MSTAGRHTPHYTVADYEQWQGDWELWDGHPVAMSPSPSARHQRVAGRLFIALDRALRERAGCNCEVLYETDWRISRSTVVRPDLMVVCEPVETRWVEVTPALIAEVVFPGTEQNDREFKRRLYAEQGVAYYLIVDPEVKEVEALRLVDGAYQVGDSTDLNLREGCGLRLELAGLWF